VVEPLEQFMWWWL